MTDLVTDSQDELSFEDLFRDVDQVHIPLFQREYVWKGKEFDDLKKDIGQISSGIESCQFLGAVVAYERPRQSEIVGRLRSHAIVDGQQRLMTIYIFVMAIVECLARNGDKDDAIEAVRDYLLLPSRRGLEVNTRIVPSFADRNQFRVLWDKINSPAILQAELEADRPHPPSPNGPSDGCLVNQYNRIIRYLNSHVPPEREAKKAALLEILEIATRKLTFVQLKLTDASSATKIFERLNFRGVKVGVVDLVRNEVFSNLINDPTETNRIFNHIWRPFEDAFNGRAEAFFFPYCLTQNSNTKKSELFSQLRTTWDKLTPEEIISHMQPYQGPFVSIDQTGRFGDHRQISIRLDRLVRLGRPSSVYPYVMSMLNARAADEIDDECVISLLDTLESFLVRRAILGFEPTGLHSLFKGLWRSHANYSIAEFMGAVAERATVQWPNDAELKDAVRKRSLATTNICQYLLVEYDRSLPGDNPTDAPTIEHVLPQQYEEGGAWSEVFTKDEHKKLKDTWANLIPLSGPLNSSLQAGPYTGKQPRYRLESMFVSARNLADRWDNWSPESVAERSEMLANWAVERWPHTMRG
ncbi:DUF262 domain-containing protein [Pseudokordiimonas caeni]|uniref:DUF262 domain-containing protein n=1 Tax=Pseudokordiimonas caeni TaxID=2997908 RepID=UPI002812576C|nr:DUF262 domain-containing HNH endonuclease family protein [Pseudokordiimonas caeni]